MDLLRLGAVGDILDIDDALLASDGIAPDRVRLA